MLEILNTTKQKFCRRKANRITEGILNFYRMPKAEVSLVVVGDQKMRTLNRDFHGQDKTTDVLSFPADKQVSRVSNNQYLGEIFINISETARVYKYESMFQELGLKPRNKTYIFYFLLVHGLLHLVGYQDKQEKDRQAMLALGEKFMKKWYN